MRVSPNFEGELKEFIEREARRRDVSKAWVVRQAVKMLKAQVEGCQKTPERVKGVRW